MVCCWVGLCGTPSPMTDEIELLLKSFTELRDKLRTEARTSGAGTTISGRPSQSAGRKIAGRFTNRMLQVYRGKKTRGKGAGRVAM